MDESLSDFQEEKKKSCTGPKNVKNPKVNQKKKPKRIKGQRDIRVLVKSKKNELVSYSKDFDEICKESGIDVDSEQLQLAIALSKSLQDSESKGDVELDAVKPLTTQERTRKIKSTLKEYGFHIPNGVIRNCNKKRTSHKKYKLLLTSDTDKSEIISRKYEEVLKNNPTTRTDELNDFLYTGQEIYFKTTNICYNEMKNVETFYTPNLVEKTSHKTCLLRDWSKIPGRPVSPEPKVSNFKFEEFEFTQEELDGVLSSPLHVAQDIIKEKYKIMNKQANIEERFETVAPTVEEVNTKEDSMFYDRKMNFKNDTATTNMFNNETHKIISVNITHRARSKSPDMFDDDDLSIVVEPEQRHYSVIKTSSSTVMDLTECVGDVKYSQEKQSNKLLASEPANASSNDIIIMDYSYSIDHLQDEQSKNFDNNDEVSLKGIHVLSKDLITQYEKMQTVTPTSSEVVDLENFSNKVTDTPLKKQLCSETVIELNDFMEITECVVSEFNQKDVKNIDLTQQSDKTYNDELIPQKELLLQDEEKETNTIKSIKESCKLNEDLQCFGSPLSSTSCFLPKAVLQVLENIDTQSTSIYVKEGHKEVNTINGYIDYKKRAENINEKETITMDLTQSSNSSEDLPMVHLSGVSSNTSLDNTIIMSDDDIDKNIKTVECKISSKRIQILEEDSLTHHVSHEQYLSNAAGNNDKFDTVSEDDGAHDTCKLGTDDNNINIDLTQSPGSHNHHSDDLGKQNDISIDYDDLYDNMMRNEISKKYCTSSSENRSKTSYDIIDQECEIIDDEKIVDVSIDKNVSYAVSPVQIKDHFGSISSKISKNFCYLLKVRNSKSDNTEIPNENLHTSPLELSDLDNKPMVQTPVNDKYIIKTDNVTPILDYESMTTPARNKELEKYGIKPFKRKRAIQLLTYLYNQTHPVVEQCPDDMPSTTKKLKIDDQRDTNETQKNALNSPKQPEITSSQVYEEKDSNKENNMYRETKQHPDVKEIECRPEEWVFQTREKAKVQSCRVPLHIAFHNYVSCRSLLREAILRYEPVNIDIIHKDLVASGFRYNPKELLKFMDKKCITVKTTENNSRNKKI